MPFSYKKTIWIYLTFCLLLPFSGVNAGDVSEAPVKIRSALFLKLMAFNKNLTGDISVYVLNDEAFAEEFKKNTGKTTGGVTLASVESGPVLPETVPSVIYCGDASQVDVVTGYARSNKILSITGLPGTVSKGITLGVGIAGGKPKILLNVSSSKKEGVDWNPAIFKISTIIK